MNGRLERMQNEQDDRLYKSGFWVTVCLTILIIAGIIGGGIIQNSFAKHEVLGTSTVSPTPPPPAGGPTPSQDFLTGVPESSDSADITPTVRLTLTPTPTLHPTSTSTPTPKPTESPTPTPTSPPSPTLTPSPTPTETPIPTL